MPIVTLGWEMSILDETLGKFIKILQHDKSWKFISAKIVFFDNMLQNVV